MFWKSPHSPAASVLTFRACSWSGHALNLWAAAFGPSLIEAGCFAHKMLVNASPTLTRAWGLSGPQQAPSAAVDRTDDSPTLS